MPFRGIQTKAQNDAVGPGTLNMLRSNILYLRSLLDFGHLSTGEHNTPEIARMCRQITTVPTVSPSSTDITSVAHPATGQYTLTLAANRFDTDMRLQINPIPEVGVDKPALAHYVVNSATSVDVFIKRLTSTLGVAGNVWAATNLAFDVAIHGPPLAQVGWNSIASPWQRAAVAGGYGLVGGGSNTNPSHWSNMVKEMAVLQSALIAEHTSAGVHNTRQISKHATMITYTKPAGVDKYTPDDGSLSCSYVSTGVFDITYPAALTAPVSFFVCPDYARTFGGTDRPTVINIKEQTSGTIARVRIYQWNSGSGWWEAANADCFVAIHGS